MKFETACDVVGILALVLVFAIAALTILTT